MHEFKSGCITTEPPKTRSATIEMNAMSARLDKSEVCHPQAMRGELEALRRFEEASAENRESYFERDEPERSPGLAIFVTTLPVIQQGTAVARGIFPFAGDDTATFASPARGALGSDEKVRTCGTSDLLNRLTDSHNKTRGPAASILRSPQARCSSGYARADVESEQGIEERDAGEIE
ncbi:hypothetical protein B0H10DRAFT_1951123 [Mycena sp. CBHHK59/15]|nr:hypothetical protein B0H10DRAFT_1951123 [Mycena sp. CBHHK59/15]